MDKYHCYNIAQSTVVFDLIIVPKQFESEVSTQYKNVFFEAS